MSVEKKLHDAQVAILHVLLFTPSAGFAELQKASKLSSDHFNFHLKQLLDEDLIVKNDAGKYHLTRKGKEFANRFDTDAKVVERQPKIAVLLIVERDDGKILAQQRRKQPFYGYWGRPTGKIRWGETILEAAARELKEETNLEADHRVCGIYHKMDYVKQSDELLEDKIFFVVHCTNVRGDMIDDFDGGHNAWMNDAEIAAQEKVFGDMGGPTASVRGEAPLLNETRHYYTPDQY